MHGAGTVRLVEAFEAAVFDAWGGSFASTGHLEWSDW